MKEHIELNMTLNKIAKKNDSAKNEYDLLDLNQVLDFCKLSNRKNVYVSDLSAGQKEDYNWAVLLCEASMLCL